jgi:hypothetical protein
VPPSGFWRFPPSSAAVPFRHPAEAPNPVARLAAANGIQSVTLQQIKILQTRFEEHDDGTVTISTTGPSNTRVYECVLTGEDFGTVVGALAGASHGRRPPRHAAPVPADLWIHVETPAGRDVVTVLPATPPAPDGSVTIGLDGRLFRLGGPARTAILAIATRAGCHR